MTPLRTRIPLMLTCAAALMLSGMAGPGAARSTHVRIVKKPTARSYQTGLSFGDRSHWLQPWRAYLDTPPATKLRDAIGINLDNTVDAEEVNGLARLLGDSGFRRARLEMGWDSIDYDHPDQLSNPGRLRGTIAALHANGIRPLILLNSNHAAPCPMRKVNLTLAAPAAAGSQRVQLDAASAAAVAPGRTGFSNLGDDKAAGVLITSVNAAGVASLSKPLPGALAAGPHEGATLLYEPFASPRLADGSPNPAFERTMAGWLAYVAAVTREVRAVIGSDNFDVEIWNELSFGSDFLSRENYYATGTAPDLDSVEGEILRRTIAFLHAPGGGLSHVGIGDGFESQRPWASGATVPAGVSAIDKHPYKNVRNFPSDAVNDGNGIRPLDAFGRTAGIQPANTSTQRWQDKFTPNYTALFPEYYLTGIQTETLIRDLSPITTDVYGTPHGRKTHPAGGAAPKMWITEWNLDPTGTTLRPTDLVHTRAKAVLRFLTSYVNKGAEAIDFFAAKHPGHELVDPSFFDALRRNPGAYPGDQAGGEVMTAMGRLAAGLRGAKAIKNKRSLRLKRIADYSGRKEFSGHRKGGMRSLYDRDVLAFLPFQLDAHSFVVPTYIMTRDLAHAYGAGSDPRRLDLPQSRYRLTIGGLKRGKRVKVFAYDPLTGGKVAVRRISNRHGKLVVDIKLTDSPRMLYITERG